MIVFALLLAGFSAVYFWFLIRVYSGIKKLISADKGSESKIPFISIIVPFRNEADNLRTCLTGLTNQHYPNENFELIFVDDGSTDDYEEIEAEFNQNKNVIFIKAESNGTSGHKKAAIERGVERARGEWLVTTDADCRHPANWLKSISRSFSEETGFVSGPVAFSGSPGIFAKLQNLEFSGLILSGAGMISSGWPIICNGANLAFRKTAFREVNGYAGNKNLSSGDDEFLMRKIFRTGKWRVNFCFDRQAVVLTNPVHAFRPFVNQRRRWASKGLFYESAGLILLLVSMFSFFLLVLAGLIWGAVSGSVLFGFTAVLLFLKAVAEFFILIKGKELGFPKFHFFTFMLAEILHIPYIIAASVLGALGNFEWKGRELKR